MKKTILLGVIGLAFLQSCDKVDNAYDPYIPSTDLDYSLYPGGGEQDYLDNEWPTFSANTNTDRNILVEDYTGHQCVNCPEAAVIAEDIKDANPGRAFIASIHASPEGAGAFQAVDATFTEDFTCQEGLDICYEFGYVGTPGSPFVGNPGGTISRDDTETGYPVQPRNTWANTAANLLAANDLKVNIQAVTNYFPSTRGIFLHTETEILDAALTNELKIVVQLIEDTLVGPQKVPSSDPNYPIDYNYVHHDIMRGCIDGRAFGQVLDEAHMDANGKYYFNYSYELPAQYDDQNVHLIVYIRDAVTEEIYQVIEQHLY